MTKQDYEKARQQCWNAAALNNRLDDSEENKERFFDFVFDNAYALGKQENDADDGSLWSRLTDDEKREMQCRYHTNEFVLRDHKKRTGDKAQTRATARMKLLENLFGKENLKAHNNG